VATCFCSELPTLPTRTQIVILQHRTNVATPFGTARLVALCLKHSRIHVAYKGLSGDLHCPIDVPRDAAICSRTRVLRTSPTCRRRAPDTLVVLDGTWAHSKRLYRENPWLQRLQHVRLRPPEPSRYRIRREPQPTTSRPSRQSCRRCASSSQARRGSTACWQPSIA
jgi:DTW domain-containing protein YfiP